MSGWDIGHKDQADAFRLLCDGDIGHKEQARAFHFLRDGDIDHKEQTRAFHFLRDGDIDHKEQTRAFHFLRDGDINHKEQTGGNRLPSRRAPAVVAAASSLAKKYRPVWSRTVRDGASAYFRLFIS
ncbi:hypothetical protein ABD76_11370 [Paenibacillus dendritiformis]|uniref:hypothetical protein n=1 Tax=Paenibacillus dendritiformis TaxID=130049 RepID=UPI0018CE3036|nr:hypothetical protein [Paenibacillus dendritiformis]MBG9793054.1 hypothetical protein [Paenibacillus dendritiformis]